MTTPEPPWETVVDAVVWVHRAHPDARDALPPGLRDAVLAEVTVGAVLTYLASPVGTYSEVLAAPLLLRRPGVRLPGVTVPFIAVDSPASVAGGREGWALPKVLAQFGGGGPGASGRRTAAGEDWSVRASPGAGMPGVPLALWFSLTQPWPDGRLRSATVHAAGRARATRVQVDLDGPGVPPWLRAGRHPGAVVRRVRQRVGAPRG